jgi:hypothetical protein
MAHHKALLAVAASAICVAAALFAGLSAYATNPIIPEGKFLSDPAPRVGPDGKLWVFGSRDRNAKEYCSDYNDVLETTDLLSWRLHEGVLASTGPNDGVPQSDSRLYAPDAMYIDGKWCLFYCMPDKNHKEGLAVSDSPTGPYKSVCAYDWCGKTHSIDPSIFRDDDGTLYYNWGQFALNGTVLKPDLSGYVPGTLKRAIVTEAQHNFHEGIQLTKRNGIYYLVFADIGRRRTPTCIGYATANRPFGPYTYRGVIVDNYGCDPRSWNNHGGIVEYKGRWYVFYHRSTNGSKTMRKACVEPIEFDENGFIDEVETTSNGAGPELDPFASTPARIACVMSGGARIVTMDDGRERIGRIRAGDTATWRYFNGSRSAASLRLKVVARKQCSVEVRDGKGVLYGRGTIPAGDGAKESEVEVKLDRPFPSGRAAVVLAFHGKRNEDLFDLVSFTFLE